MLDLSSLQNSDDWYSVAASPSGRWLLICDWVSKCWLWDMQVAYPSAASKILKGHTSGIVSQAFSADEQWLLTSGLNDRTIVVSDLTGPNLVAQSIVLSPGQPLVIQYFDPDEGWLIAQGVEHEQETWVWQLKWEDLIILACQITGRNMTRTEWAQYLPDKPYRITCPQWSAGQ
jgi:WD40 repeat protein